MYESLYQGYSTIFFSGPPGGKKKKTARGPEPWVNPHNTGKMYNRKIRMNITHLN